jgi:hypothetical protein
MDARAIHVPYGSTVVPCASWRGSDARTQHFRRIDAAAQLASGASRAACYGYKGAAGPGRIDLTSPFGPIHLPYSRSA